MKTGVEMKEIQIKELKLDLDSNSIIIHLESFVYKYKSSNTAS